VEIETMQSVLKDYVQRSGETYQALAVKLRVSIATAKRMLNGDDLSMDRALEICDAIGVNFSEFLADTAAASVRYRYYTEAQEQYLAKRFDHFAFLRLMQKGWSTDQIREAFGLGDRDIAAYTGDLERAGFLVTTPQGHVRLLAKDGMDWTPNGALWKVFMRGWVDSVVESFHGTPFAEDRAFVDITQRTLSAESFAQLQRELDELSRKYKAIGAAEMRTKRKGQTFRTYHSLFMLSEWTKDFWKVGPYSR
jgi:transcriptional regulator with XRE-family HTH domain